MNCECGRPLITLPSGETICAATAERFKAMHGYEYGFQFSTKGVIR